MSREEASKVLETDLDDPGSQKSGEYLEVHVLDHSKKLADDDRDGLVQVLKDWIRRRDEPRTMLAVKVAKELKLHELKPDIEGLRDDTLKGRAFPAYYVRWIDDALTRM